MGDNQRALSDFNRADALRPNDVETLHNRVTPSRERGGMHARSGPTSDRHRQPACIMVSKSVFDIGELGIGAADAGAIHGNIELAEAPSGARDKVLKGYAIGNVASLKEGFATRSFDLADDSLALNLTTPTNRDFRTGSA